MLISRGRNWGAEEDHHGARFPPAGVPAFPRRRLDVAQLVGTVGNRVHLHFDSLAIRWQVE